MQFGSIQPYQVKISAMHHKVTLHSKRGEGNISEIKDGTVWMKTASIKGERVFYFLISFPSVTVDKRREAAS